MMGGKKRKVSSSLINDDDESNLLATLGSSLQNMDEYEQGVLNTAELEQTPRLSGIGFPLVLATSLAPSGRAISDLPHVQNVLAKIRNQLIQQPHNLTLLLQQQMLLNVIHTTTNDSEQCIRLQEELRQEQIRRRRFHRQTNDNSNNNRKPTAASAARKAPRKMVYTNDDEDDDERKAAQRLEEIKQQKNKSVTFAAAATPPERRRIGIQKRQRGAAGIANASASASSISLEEETDEELLKRKAGLKKIREKREKKRIERHQKWGRSKSKSSDPKASSKKSASEKEGSEDEQEVEFEFEGDGEKDGAKVSARRKDTNPPNNRLLQMEREDIYVESSPTNIDDEFDTSATSDELGPFTAVTTDCPTSQEDKQLVVDTCREDTFSGDKTTHIAPTSLDDFDEDDYEDRVDDWIENGIHRMRVMKERDSEEQPPGEEFIDGGLVVPAWVNDRLFPYQRTGLRWMWELHRQQAGGIIGDEMGLGKTVQLCAFLGSMAACRKLKSILVIAPATMLQHWLSELKIWAPGIRRIMIHQSAEAGGPILSSKRTISQALLRNVDLWLKASRRDRLFEAIDEDDYNSRAPWSFCGTAYTFVTTYENVRRNPDIWTNHPWSYIVMDEAQKIRNPDADITLVCKRLRTPHRLALSGTPIQNDLRELWSLFDFVLPGRLGTLHAFENEFADPIKRGGYSNASPMQVQLAYRCALVIRDLIKPYLLRRLKTDVKEVNRMPGKKEQVLFCRLSSHQRMMYEAFLQSDEVKQIMRGSLQMLGAITMLRKICNHPDLVCPPDQLSFDTFIQRGSFAEADIAQDYSDEDDSIVDEGSLTDRSGKLQVLAKILPLWKKQGHRVLIFCQWKKMLNIIQAFTESRGWKFGRLDGDTNVAARQRLVDTFNTDESYYGMLMTTRTGGVGLNLTGADRIILYDPDWNPQTDAQARERAWRFGQEREVTIYRLIAAGTVEEKIYQRQIFKTALSNRVLQDPRQRRLFSQKDLKDLFTLKVDGGSVISGSEGLTETGQLTKGQGYVDPDEEVTEDAPASANDRDDGETMQSVLRSKGLAGIFDHEVVESNKKMNKKASDVEMEEDAKRVARAAVRALKESVVEPQNSRFVARSGPSSSSNLLASIRKQLS